MFPSIRFQGQLRPSQREVDAIASGQLADGQRRLHIVAPPGAGKTIIGLFLWACRLRRPALVLSPNSAIQAQWAARTDLFARADGGNLAELVSTSADDPRLLTSLTYQSITLPARGDERLEARAIDLWIQTILEKEQAESTTAAEIWVADLRRHNPEYYRQRLAYYRKRIREDDAAGGQVLGQLHDTCLQTLERLRQADVGLLILDECHHLLGHWGRVLTEVGQYLGDPVVLGLTATPPDPQGRAVEDVERYDRFFGPIDFEVPVPAVVKDGYLAPYQDLAYLVRPTAGELSFIAQADQQFGQLVEQLCCRPDRQQVGGQQCQSLLDWLQSVLREKWLPGGRVSDWRAFHARDPNFAEATVRFLQSRGVSLPSDVPALGRAQQIGLSSDLVTLIDRFTRHHLRCSPHRADHRLAELAVDRLRMLGVQITETGHRPCATPVSRVIAYTRNKAHALIPILHAESAALGKRVRAVVIADFEKTSATSAEIAHLLDEEAGGAVAAFRTLLDDPTTNRLDPVLLTGSTVLVDADLIVQFQREAKLWLRQKSKQVELQQQLQGTFYRIHGVGQDWSPRVYVEMITDLFQRGITRCLVGTRGLLGEGWDASRINVLIDLSTTTTSTSVNQLRGRSIRLDPHDREKLANNWDVVCIAPEFNRGLDDYDRFGRKHRSVFGICDDGAIEQGIGHVHAAFTDLKPELLDGNLAELNNDMLKRAGRRQLVYQLWAIGQAFSTDPIRAIEVRNVGGTDGLHPAFEDAFAPWTTESLVRAIARSVLAALDELEPFDGQPSLQVTRREGGYVRVFLRGASQANVARFAAAISEALGPHDQPRYVIPRFADTVSEPSVARWMPKLIRRWLQHRERSLAILQSVPAELAVRRRTADVFNRYWNQWVSPGEAIYARNDKGRQWIEQADAAGQLPRSILHDKQVFL